MYRKVVGWLAGRRVCFSVVSLFKISYDKPCLISDATIGLVLSLEYPFGANSFCRSFFFRVFECLVLDYSFISFLNGLQPALFLGAFHSIPVCQRVSFRARGRICHSSCFDAFFSGGASLFASALLRLFGMGFMSLSAACSCLLHLSAILTARSTISRSTGFSAILTTCSTSVVSLAFSSQRLALACLTSVRP